MLPAVFLAAGVVLFMLLYGGKSFFFRTIWARMKKAVDEEESPLGKQILTCAAGKPLQIAE